MSEYEHVQKGSLKLKGVSLGGVKKKKKKKEKSIERKLEQISTGTDSGGEQTSNGCYANKRTKAEMTFEYVKRKRDAEQILQKASKTHKERILVNINSKVEFNKHLDSMTEHFDIPKVSWTK